MQKQGGVHDRISATNLKSRYDHDGFPIRVRIYISEVSSMSQHRGAPALPKGCWSCNKISHDICCWDHMAEGARASSLAMKGAAVPTPLLEAWAMDSWAGVVEGQVPGSASTTLMFCCCSTPRHPTSQGAAPAVPAADAPALCSVHSSQAQDSRSMQLAARGSCSLVAVHQTPAVQHCLH